MKLRIAIAGATGAVGHELLRLLEARAPDDVEVALFASANSAGRKLRFRDRELSVSVLEASAIAGCDYAFFSCGKERSLRHAREVAANGTIVIDNSSAFRLDEDVPLVVPEVNAAALRATRDTRLVANPNCSTILLVVALAPLLRAFGLKRVIVSSYQAASGAGQRAMDLLVDDTRSRLRVDAPGSAPANASAEAFGHGLAFNLIPQIDVLLDDGRTGEEHKMLAETRKILERPDLAVDATCVRVPVLRCHAESVTIETVQEVGVEQARAVLEGAPGLRLVDGPDRFPMPSTAEGTEIVEVGRLRRSAVFDHGLTFFLCGDQLLKGAALNAVQIFESLQASRADEPGATATT